MSQRAFDPFGEPVPASHQRSPRIALRKWLKSAGTSLFCVLVARIVLALAVYFEPRNFSFYRAVACVQGVFAFL